MSDHINVKAQFATVFANARQRSFRGVVNRVPERITEVSSVGYKTLNGIKPIVAEMDVYAPSSDQKQAERESMQQSRNMETIARNKPDLLSVQANIDARTRSFEATYFEDPYETNDRHVVQTGAIGQVSLSSQASIIKDKIKELFEKRHPTISGSELDGRVLDKQQYGSSTRDKKIQEKLDNPAIFAKHAGDAKEVVIDAKAGAVIREGVKDLRIYNLLDTNFSAKDKLPKDVLKVVKVDAIDVVNDPGLPTIELEPTVANTTQRAARLAPVSGSTLTPPSGTSVTPEDVDQVAGSGDPRDVAVMLQQMRDRTDEASATTVLGLFGSADDPLVGPPTTTTPQGDQP